MGSAGLIRVMSKLPQQVVWHCLGTVAKISLASISAVIVGQINKTSSAMEIRSCWGADAARSYSEDYSVDKLPPAVDRPAIADGY